MTEISSKDGLDGSGPAADTSDTGKEPAAGRLEGDGRDAPAQGRDATLLPGFVPPPPMSGEAAAAAAETPAGDEELMRILEDLNDTLDSAHALFGELQARAGETETVAAEAEPSSPPPPPSRARRGSFVPAVLAAGAGLTLGLAGFTVPWPVWTAGLAGLTGGVADAPAHQTVAAYPSRPETAAAPEPVAPAPEPAVASAPEPVTAPTPVKTEARLPVIEPDAPARPEAAEGPGGRAPSPPPLGAEEEASLMARGDTLLKAGDVASARLLYEHAARRGSAAAMYALGRTYDPAALAGRTALGIRPDREAALRWYRRAAQAGHAAALAAERSLQQQAGH